MQGKNIYHNTMGFAAPKAAEKIPEGYLMKTFNTLMDLQLFAEGAGDGGGASGEAAGAAEAGESAVDAEQQRLLELNVPKDKVERWAKRRDARAKRNGQTMAQAASQPQPDATAQTQTTEQEEEAQEPEAKPEKPSWEELMKDPDYNKAMQETMKARVAKAGQAEGFAKMVAPLLAQQYGLDAENIDLNAIAKAVGDAADHQREEQEASAFGVSTDTIRQIRQSQQAEQESIQDKRLREHAARVIREAEEMKQLFPNFDLMAERESNEVFRRMVDNPDNPVPLQTAYFAAHHDELVQTAVQKALQEASQKLTASMQANARRPDEAGADRQASSVTTFDYAKATRQEREALKARIRAAAARGEKIYPGM